MTIEEADPPEVAQSSALRVIERAWHHLREDDFSSFLELLSADVVWHVPPMPGVPFAGTWYGIDGVKRFFRIVADAQDTIAFEPERFVADGDTVVVQGYFNNRIRSTGRESRSDWVQVWTVAAGKISGMHEYVDTHAVAQAFRTDDPPQTPNQTRH